VASGIPYTIIRSTSSWNSSRASPLKLRMEARSGFRPGCSSPSRRTTLLPPLPRWRSQRRKPFNEIVARYLKAVGDPREVVRDPATRYFGSRIEENSLVPLGEARLGRIGFDESLRRSQARI
jgi:hypothetical protein